MLKKKPFLSFITLSFIAFLFIGLCSLGRWQLLRGYEKQDLIQAQQQASQGKTIDTVTLLSQPLSALQYKPIALKAYLNLKQAFLLDNQIYQGRIGYHVLIPLEIKPKIFILLNIGWTPAPPSRDELPNIENMQINQIKALDNQQITIEGYIEKGYVNPLITKTLESKTISWPLRVQHMDYTLFSQILGGNVLPGIIILEKPKVPDVFPPPKSQTWLTPEKHFGYAFQWFSLATVLLVMTFISVRKLRNHE